MVRMVCKCFVCVHDLTVKLRISEISVARSFTVRARIKESFTQSLVLR